MAGRGWEKRTRRTGGTGRGKMWEKARNFRVLKYGLTWGAGGGIGAVEVFEETRVEEEGVGQKTMTSASKSIEGTTGKGGEMSACHLPDGAAWVVPKGVLAYGVAVLLLVVGIQGVLVHGIGWRVLLAVRFSPVLYAIFVCGIRFFKVTSEDVTAYSVLGLWRKRIRLENICSVCGREDADILPVVYVRCHDGRVIRWGVVCRKTGEKLIAQIRMRLGDEGSAEACRRPAFRGTSDPLQVVFAEWLMSYGVGVAVLYANGFLLYMFLERKGVLGP